MADYNFSFDEAQKILAGKKGDIEALLLAGMEKALLLVEADSKRNCTKIDEGLLRASIDHATEIKDDEVVGRVGTNLEYAPYVHQGTGIYAIDGNGRKTPWFWEGDSSKWEGVHLTHGQKPNPFLQDAIDNNRDKLDKIFKEALEGLK